MKNSMHMDLAVAIEFAFEPLELIVTNVTHEAESQEYGACSFDLGTKKINFRMAKITPTKMGQFVTFWKRSAQGPIAPYDVSDSFDFLIVSVRDAENFGLFVFPKDVLYDQGLLSKNGIGGKRAMRVYPPWVLADNKQAKKTQGWQIRYFFAIQPALDIEQVKNLLPAD